MFSSRVLCHVFRVSFIQWLLNCGNYCSGEVMYVYHYGSLAGSELTVYNSFNRLFTLLEYGEMLPSLLSRLDLHSIAVVEEAELVTKPVTMGQTRNVITIRK